MLDKTRPESLSAAMTDPVCGMQVARLAGKVRHLLSF